MSLLKCFKSPIILLSILSIYSFVHTNHTHCDEIEFQYRGRAKKISANVIARDSQNTMMVEDRDTHQYLIPESELLRWEKSDEPVKPFDSKELREHLENEFGESFKTDSTKHYVLIYNTDREFADEASTLFEKSYKSFWRYFSTQGKFKLEEPKAPLIAVIFKSRLEYIDYIEQNIGVRAAGTSGMYVPLTNRLYLYDAFGGSMQMKLKLIAQSNQELANESYRKLVEQNISVVIHEGIHQVAYNCGFHKRHNQNPLWLVEGIAMFFDTPDVNSKNYFAGVGKPNLLRLNHFREMVESGRVPPLQTLFQADEPVQNPDTAMDAYSLAWAMNYFLAKSKKKEYFQLIEHINQRKSFTAYTPAERMESVKTFFGDLNELEEDFHRYLKIVIKKYSDEN